MCASMGCVRVLCVFKVVHVLCSHVMFPCTTCVMCFVILHVLEPFM